jgi:hypothetical protein
VREVEARNTKDIIIRKKGGEEQNRGHLSRFTMQNSKKREGREKEEDNPRLCHPCSKDKTPKFLLYQKHA